MPTHVIGCACSGCSGAEAAQADGTTSFSSSTTKPVYSQDEVIHALTTFDGTFSSVAWARDQLSFSISSGMQFSGDPHYQPEYEGYRTMTALMESRARSAFQLWDDLIAIELIEVEDNPGANIIFNYSTETSGMSYARYGYTFENNQPRSTYTMVDAEIWIDATSPALDNDDDLAWWRVGPHVYIHEVGHTLGITHPGQYNISANYAEDATHYQDTRQYTVMSYFDAEENGSGADHIDGATRAFGATPLLHDILAVQAVYGADMMTRTGDTTYGFNSNAGREPFDFTVNPRPVVAIWDAGGIDTIDVSGFSTDQRVDLNEGAFSSVGPLTQNLAIAWGALIENATGGPGDDRLIGNALANALRGGGGGDTLIGAAGADFLEGGAGADQFQFLVGSNASGNSHSVFAAPDVTSDFARADGDKLVFELGPDLVGAPLVFRGELPASFTNTVGDALSRPGIVSGSGYTNVWWALAGDQLAVYADSDDDGLLDADDFTVRLANPAEDPLLASDFVGVGTTDPASAQINGAVFAAEAYAGQDKGTAESLDGGATVTLSGNAWKQASLPLTVTADTVLRLDFTAVAGGEIQGIAFENDDLESPGTLFQFSGSQAFGIQDFNDAAPGVTRSYEIPVGNYFTGEFDRLVFVSDDDAGGGAVSEFGNIEFIETPEVLISGTPYVARGFPSQDAGELSSTDGGATITLSGNAWKQASLPLTVTSDTVLRLDFTAVAGGEIQGIAFETDDEATPGTLFQFSGSQAYGIQDFNDAAPGVTRSYEIPVGYYFTGEFDRLVFVSDDDAGGGAVSEFGNIEFIEGPEVLISGTPYVARGFPSQDAGELSSTDGGATITLSGNAWKQASLPLTVTSDTVLRLDFTAVAGGEIQGIAFETDDEATPGTLFQFSGSQAYGIQDFNDAAPGVTRSYEIPVGDYFTGEFDRLVFVSDDDAGGGAVSAFGNIELIDIA